MAEQIDLNNLLPYGDTTNDGYVQLSFSFPVSPSPKAKEAAGLLVKDWGFDDVKVVHMSEVGEGYCFFVAFARATKGINYNEISVPELSTKERDYKEVDALILKNIKRPIKLVGACTGFDAHTVGLDAILNMKGFDGDVGLERYKGFDVFNMGSQVQAEDLIEKAIKEKVDVILVSKIVTQKDIHILDLKEIQARLKKKGLEDRFIVVAGGPRVTHKMALELGFDAGFTIGTRPVDVANFIYEKMLEKKQKSKKD